MTVVYDPLAWLNDELAGTSNTDKSNAAIASGTQKKPGESTGSGGGSGSSRSSGGSGGGGSTVDNSQQYIQLYRIIFGKNVKPNMTLVNNAVKNNWSSAYFRLQVRLLDKNYFQSAEAKKRAADFNATWKTMFSGVKVNKQALRTYLRGDMNKQQTEDFLLSTKAGKTYYKYYKGFEAAQAKGGIASNPLLYKKYQQAFRDAYKAYGIEPPAGYEKLYFKSGLSDEQFVNNLQTAGVARAAMSWGGQEAAQEPETAALFDKGKKGSVLRKKMTDAIAVQQSYLKGTEKGFSSALEDDTLVQKGI